MINSDPTRETRKEIIGLAFAILISLVLVAILALWTAIFLPSELWIMLLVAVFTLVMAVVLLMMEHDVRWGIWPSGP